MQQASGKVELKPWSKTVESWNAGGSDYFVMHMSDGSDTILRPTAQVSLEDLNMLAGTDACLTGAFVEPKPYTPLSPMEQYPVDYDGGPIARGGGFEVFGLSCDG